MPCRDSSFDYDSDHVRLTREQWNKINIAAAALCAISRVLEDANQLSDTLDKIDWRSAGITKKQYRVWWAEHKQEDDDRRTREAAKRELEGKKAAARNKLTAEERDLLGIK